MPIFIRRSGSKASARAVLHSYENDTAKIEVSIDINVAKEMLAKAVDQGGTAQLSIMFEGKTVSAEAIGARIDSIGLDGKRIGGTGVIEFSSIEREK